MFDFFQRWGIFYYVEIEKTRLIFPYFCSFSIQVRYFKSSIFYKFLILEDFIFIVKSLTRIINISILFETTLSNSFMVRLVYCKEAKPDGFFVKLFNVYEHNSKCGEYKLFDTIISFQESFKVPYQIGIWKLTYCALITYEELNKQSCGSNEVQTFDGLPRSPDQIPNFPLSGVIKLKLLFTTKSKMHYH